MSVPEEAKKQETKLESGGDKQEQGRRVWGDPVRRRDQSNDGLREDRMGGGVAE